MNRGSLDERRRTSYGGYGFNEAPIHESGKFVRAVSMAE